MILKDIETALKTVDNNVFYGAVDQAAIASGDPWNYIIFGRASRSPSDGRVSATTHIDVHIVRENYIDDETTDAVIAAMLAIPGVRIGTEDSTYTYDYKPNTNLVIEAQIIHFIHAKKGR